MAAFLWRRHIFNRSHCYHSCNRALSLRKYADRDSALPPVIHVAKMSAQEPVAGGPKARKRGFRSSRHDKLKWPNAGVHKWRGSWSGGSQQEQKLQSFRPTSGARRYKRSWGRELSRGDWTSTFLRKPLLTFAEFIGPTWDKSKEEKPM